MDFLATAEAGLAGLFLASFLAATLLPGGSEAVLAALLLAHPEQAMPALALATLGNTLGGMSTYALGRLLPEKLMRSGIQTDGADEGTAVKHIATLRRHGAPALLLAWAPVIGDALCAAAGWLRLPWLPCAIWMALGKGGRYLVVAAGVGMV
jgi:membrane protein YqaA with SNARE-associated domain